MPAIRLKTPLGQRPGMHRTLLTETQAQTALNIRTHRGTWQPLRVPTYVSDLASLNPVQSVFRYTPTHWFEWEADVNAVRSMLTDDPWDRVYYTGDGVPKFTVNNIATAGGGGGNIVTGGSFDIQADVDLWAAYQPDDRIALDAGRMKLYSVNALGQQSLAKRTITGLTAGVTYNVAIDVEQGAGTGAMEIASSPGTGNVGRTTTGPLALSFVANAATADIWLYNQNDSAPNLDVWFDNFSVTSAAATAFPANSYTLGIPAPTSAPLPAVSGVPDNVDDPIETTFYICTYIDAYNAEGANSPVSIEVEWQPGQTVNLTGLPGAPAGAYNITTLRIYRTNTGSYGSVYQKVVDLAIGTSTYDDTTLSANLSTTTFESGAWDMPNPAMKGLIAMPGEFMVGFYGNVLAMSEAGQPHAYPPEYELKTDYDIVGIAAFGNSILVATTGTPYIAQGVSPGSMILSKTETAQACVSKRSVVDVGAGAIYASPDGLILASGGGLTGLTNGIFDRDAWQALKPESIHAYLWEGLYLAFYDTGVAKGAFAINPVSPQDGVIFYDRYITAGYNDLEEDALYIAQAGTPQTLSTWDSGGTNETMVWKSKIFTTPSPVNFGVAQVRAEAYPVTLRLVSDGVEHISKSVPSAEPFRLPPGRKGVEYEVQISGVNTAYEVVVAQHMNALRRI